MSVSSQSSCSKCHAACDVSYFFIFSKQEFFVIFVKRECDASARDALTSTSGNVCRHRTQSNVVTLATDVVVVVAAVGVIVVVVVVLTVEVNGSALGALDIYKFNSIISIYINIQHTTRTNKHNTTMHISKQDQSFECASQCSAPLSSTLASHCHVITPAAAAAQYFDRFDKEHEWRTRARR